MVRQEPDFSLRKCLRNAAKMPESPTNRRLWSLVSRLGECVEQESRNHYQGPHIELGYCSEMWMHGLQRIRCAARHPAQAPGSASHAASLLTAPRRAHYSRPARGCGGVRWTDRQNKRHCASPPGPRIPAGVHRRPKAIQAFLEGLCNRGDLHVGS